MRIVGVSAMVTLASWAVFAAAPGAGAVSVTQSYRIPADGTFTIAGHGYGHGHGMSQYGAEGAARQGLSHRQILGFYYPGTSMDTVKGKIRVLISGDTSDDVVVLPSTGLAVRDLGSGQVYALPRSGDAERWRLTTSGSRSVVQFLAGGRWRAYSPGGREALAGDGEFTNTADLLTLVTPTGRHRYRGTLRAASPYAGSGARDTVNKLTINNYVKGVVPSEMPASWSPEAVQSQAVAARTYGLWSRQSRLKRSWQICDTTACQVYRGYDYEHPDANAAVAATAGQILRYGGAPAFTQFSASSGGWTSQGSVSYLPHKRDPYDGWSGNPVHSWSTRVSEATAERRYPGIGDLRRIDVTEREGGGDWQGRVRSLTLVGSSGRASLSGDGFRSLYSLRSTWFTIK